MVAVAAVVAVAAEEAPRTHSEGGGAKENAKFSDADQSDSNMVISVAVSICYMVVPNFQNLNMAAIDEVITVPSSLWQESNIIQYIAYNMLHATIYCIYIVWLAVFLFKRKEIA